jgi:DNA-binding transcriptional regulator YbjK
MPPNPERRTEILDAAISILADTGVGGLTHRQVDARAGVPAGTTSNYCRTRQALLESTAGRAVELHWQRVESLIATIGPMSRGGVRALMTRMLSDAGGQARQWTLARFELFMEGTRRPALRPYLDELQAAAIKSATVILESGGYTPTDAQVVEISRLLNGLVFSSLTLPAEQFRLTDPAGLVDRILRVVLDDAVCHDDAAVM